MEKIIVGAGAGAGYVRACFSRRARGHAAALDLLRAHLRGVALRRRLAEAFSGYLVSEPEECAAPVWRDDVGRVVCFASSVRKFGNWPGEMRPGFEQEPVLDAPDWLPAGSVRRYQYIQWKVCAADRRFFRDGVWL